MNQFSVDAGVATRPILSEKSGLCGDMGLIKPIENGVFAAMIDGLGHGASAHAVAREACDHLNQVDPHASLDSIMLSLQKQLRGSLGCVAALCRVDSTGGWLDFCGLGNISTRIVGASSATLLPQDGIIGQVAPKPRVQRRLLHTDSILVMHSDGISSRIRSAELNRLLQGEPQVAAEHLIANLGRDSDDAGCVVIRIRS